MSPEQQPPAQIVIIPEGSSYQQAATLLKRERLIRSRIAFIFLGKLKAADEAMAKSNEAHKAVEAERDELKKKLEGAGGDAAKVAELEGKLKAAETERDELKKKVEAGGGDAAKVAELEGKLKTAEAERDDLKKKLEAGGGDAAKVAELEGKVKTATEALTKAAEACKAAGLAGVK